MAQAALKIERALKPNQTVLITSNKGGTGKTTTAINMALAAAYDATDVCIVDLDSQRSADGWALMRRKYSALPQIPVYAEKITDFRRALRRAEHHQLTVIDTPPDVSGHPLPFNSMIDMADFILVPTLTGPFDLKAVGPWVMDHLKPAKGHKVAYVLNRIAMRSLAFQTAYEFLSKRGRICGIPVRNLTSIEQRMISGQSVLDNASDEKGKEDFTNLWTWMSQELDR